MNKIKNYFLSTYHPSCMLHWYVLVHYGQWNLHNSVVNQLWFIHNWDITAFQCVVHWWMLGQIIRVCWWGNLGNGKHLINIHLSFTCSTLRNSGLIQLPLLFTFVFFYSQIWLNCLMDDFHFTNITKIERKKKKHWYKLVLLALCWLWNYC
jgi:hypothetical protein